MRRSAEAGGHPDTADYITGVINAAFLADAPEPEDGEAPDSAPDMDDGIPF
jgi:hypothetical protein